MSDNNAHTGPEGDTSVDVVVVGAGVAGLYAVHKLRGQGLTVRAFEAGSDVGGTWFWNRYPGARCDVESVDYSFSFDTELEQEWDWSERYATQPEILAYLEHVADRHDLRRSFRFDTRVLSTRLDEGSGTWSVRIDSGETVTSRFVVFATGSLSAVRLPDIPGVESFAGRTIHTARWPHEQVDFTGRRVGVIGTGSSGIQLTPIVAQQAQSLTVFQRTANYSVPAYNEAHTDQTRAEYRAGYAERRRLSVESHGGSPHFPHPQNTFDVDADERRAAYERQWKLGGVLFTKTFPDQTRSEEANAEARKFYESKIREKVDNPAVADRLIPHDHPIGTKRICTDSGYFEAFNRDNVELVDLKQTPITEITPDGVRTADTLHELDDLIFATGFDALTGALAAIEIQGRDGRMLREEWASGPRTYLGLGVHGFPNMFIVTGPGSPSVLANMILGGEHHVDWISQTIAHLDEQEIWGLEPTSQAQEAWVEECADLASQTMMVKANSWYLGANISGKPRVFMPYIGGFARYREILADVTDSGYRGFSLHESPEQAAAQPAEIEDATS